MPVAFELINIEDKQGPYVLDESYVCLSQVCATYEWAETLNITLEKTTGKCKQKKAEYA